MAEGTSTKGKPATYLSAFGAFALAFGCSVGWGSFVMPGNTFLPLAGPVGSALGFCLGGATMVVFAACFHFLMNRYPDGGGAYTYTKENFGYDQGFLSAWFLILTYIAVLWANATALPLIARTVFGNVFQVGFHYEVFGFHVYLGEILMAVGAVLIGALLCLQREAAAHVQSVMAVGLLGGVVICFVGALGADHTSFEPFTPAYSPARDAWGGTVMVAALAPWAYVGFESISHSAGEARFSLKKSFLIMLAAIVASIAAYALLALLSTSAAPAGNATWIDYIEHLGDYAGVESQPSFYGAFAALGPTGTTVLGVASICAIFTGVLGNYVALSRLLRALAIDGMLPRRIGELDENQVPHRAIMLICLISVALPFFGRTAISWIVDVTTVGATIAYGYTSASALRCARREGNRFYVVVSSLGVVLSLLFAAEFLIPNLTAVKTLSTESYLILAIWGILGFVYFRVMMHDNEERRLGRSIVAWVVLLGLIIFTSTVWTRQETRNALEAAAVQIEEHYGELPGEGAPDGVETTDAATAGEGYVEGVLEETDRAFFASIIIQVGLIVSALLLLLDIYRRMQQRERQIEVEKVLAEESSRAKTSFLSNMSHEIRTPMNAIIGLDNIALRDPDISPRTRERLEKIGGSANHLLGLINDILDMSRIESGRMTLKEEEFSFRELIDQVSVIVNGQCVDKGLEYSCNIVGDVADYYYGDDLKLKQVLINILGNSVKFTEVPGQVTLTIERVAQDGDRSTLRFDMADTGIGMDEEYIPKLFEAFTQEDESTTNRYGGSGLGMAITKNLVEMMGGEIEVRSKKGVGSTFTVTVTLRASERDAHREGGYALPEGLRTLVLDDDEIACEHAQLVLRSIGIEADAESDAQRALARLRDAYVAGDPYQVVLTDYKMPAMNGLEFTRALRGFDEGTTAIIMLTGYNWDIIDEDARANGVDGILAKPLFSDRLVREIHAALSAHGALGELAEGEASHEPEDIDEEALLAGRRVLMAEDVEQNADILMDLLELEDVEAEHAVNGEVAVRMFAESPAGHYDAILMDVRMPVLDGLSATRQIRALEHPDAQAIPIIAMTANVFDEDVANSFEAGMNAHLSKPVEPERLYETMARLIAEREERMG